MLIGTAVTAALVPPLGGGTGGHGSAAAHAFTVADRAALTVQSCAVPLACRWWAMSPIGVVAGRRRPTMGRHRTGSLPGGTPPGASGSAGAGRLSRRRVNDDVTSFEDAAQLGRAESGLAVISTQRPDGGVQASVVNVAFMAHPLDESVPRVVAFVTYGAVKLAHLRARPAASATVRSGWRWATVEGTAQLVGPDDTWPGVDAERLRLLLREIFLAAGGTHDDWPTYDRTMLEQRRTAVFLTPTRVYGP